MQSAAAHVLAILDRTHTPGRRGSQAVARGARGRVRARQPRPDLRHARGDATPTGTRSLDAALDAGVDHVSAYALIVEDGTALARQVRRGELPLPDDDVLADRYEQADELLAAAGLRLVRGVQLGAPTGRPLPAQPGLTGPAATGGGSGPGAHSHVGGVRWWNVKHPARYADRAGRRAQLPVGGTRDPQSPRTCTWSG